MALTVTALAAPAAFADALPEADPAVVDACFATARPGFDDYACIGQASNECQDHRADTPTIAHCMATERDRWQAIMNVQYRAAFVLFRQLDASGPQSDSAGRLADLQESQDLWKTWVEVNCRAVNGRSFGGSEWTLYVLDCELRRTAERAFELRSMRPF